MRFPTKTILIFALFFGSTFSFVSWIVSRHDIPASESTRTWAMEMPSEARAGFPLQALELPPSPLGSDLIPKEMLGGVLLNELFWFICGLLFAFLIVRIQRAKAEKLQTFAMVLGIIAVLLHFGLFTIWFD